MKMYVRCNEFLREDNSLWKMNILSYLTIRILVIFCIHKRSELGKLFGRSIPTALKEKVNLPVMPMQNLVKFVSLTASYLNVMWNNHQLLNFSDKFSHKMLISVNLPHSNTTAQSKLRSVLSLFARSIKKCTDNKIRKINYDHILKLRSELVIQQSICVTSLTKQCSGYLPQMIFFWYRWILKKNCVF